MSDPFAALLALPAEQRAALATAFEALAAALRAPPPGARRRRPRAKPPPMSIPADATPEEIARARETLYRLGYR